MADGIWQDGGLADLWPGAGVQVDGTIARGVDNSVWVSDEGITDVSDPVLTGAGPISDGTATWTRIPDWPTSTAVAAGNRRQATTPDGHLRTAQNDFTTGSSEPTWVTDGTTNTDGVAAPSGGGFGDSATEIRMYFDVWSRSDRNGASIGTLTQISGMYYQGIDNAMGNGHFTVNRHDDDYRDLCWPPRNLVRVRLDPDGPFDFDDERYKGAFVMETYTDAILEAQDQGAEEVQIAGSGVETILREAIIDMETHHPFNQTPIDFAGTVAKDWQWHINASDFASPTIGTPGSVARIFLRDEAEKSPPAIPEVTTYPTGHDFNVNHDSLGVAWSGGATDWTFGVGMTLFDVLGTLVNGGLYYQMLPSLKLRAFENRQGVDRSDIITFTAGDPTGVADAGSRQVEAMLAVSRTLVHGALADGRHTGRWTNESDSDAHYDSLVPGDIEAELGVKQAYLEYPASPTPTRLARAGATYITKVHDQHEGPPTIGVLNTEGKVAFVDYYPGDTVGLDIPEFNDPTRIHSIALVQRDSNGSVDPILEFLEDPAVNYSSTIGTAAPASIVRGGARRGLTTSPEEADETLAEDELILLWWFPPDGALTLNGSPPDQINDSGMGFQQGPGDLTIALPVSDAQYQWVVVSGRGSTVSGG